MTRYPNLYLVGAPKCGTTLMAHCLGQHPDIYAPSIKEFNFFATDLRTRSRQLDEVDYLKLYTGWGAEKFALDASPAHFVSDIASTEIYRNSPDSKILVMVRNPVDAAYSLYWQNRFNMVESLTTFELSLAAETQRERGDMIPDASYMERLLYSRVFAFTGNIARYQANFPDPSLKIIVFDDFISDTRNTVDDVLFFLGLPAGDSLNLSHQNSSKQPRSTALARFLGRPPESFSRLARALLPYKTRTLVREKLMGINSAVRPYPPMLPETRRMLTRHFTPEIERLGRLLDRDLHHWTEFDD